MLEPPALDEVALLHHVARQYHLPLERLTFLPLGADLATAVYRADAPHASYYVKLRRAPWFDASGIVPMQLAEHGISQVIVPLTPIGSSVPWSTFGAHRVSVAPFIDGHSGWGSALDAAQWATLGAVVRQLHRLPIPADLPREQFGDQWRSRVAALVVATHTPADAAAGALLTLLREQRTTIAALIEQSRAWLRAAVIGAPVLCHADLHAGNILLGDDGSLFVVDWDTLIAAPIERDLMFIGAGIGVHWGPSSAQQAFFAGYGPAAPDPRLIGHYRIERILEDIAVTADALLGSSAGGSDRPLMVEQLAAQFAPGGVVDLARATV
jgi:spectinomycin phosphotransferase